MRNEMKKLILYFLLLTVHFVAAQRAVPPLWGHRVHDEAHALSAETIDYLETVLKTHEDSTTNQVAILIIPSLDGEVLEEYSLRVAHDEWKLGGAKNDNGVLLLVAVNDRKMRIEVGQGLEGVLPDAVANRIIRNDMAPYFREQNYDDGIKAGVAGILKSISGEYEAETEEAGTELTLKERVLIGFFIFGILGVFTFLGLFVQGCAGWFMYAFLIPFYAVFPMAVLGVDGGLAALGIYLVGFPIVKLFVGRSDWGKRMATSMGSSRRGSGGWTSGGGCFSGGPSGGGWSSGSSGGFSGGGGSFGGGGSSGSW
jgi:uncharacterized protein